MKVCSVAKYLALSLALFSANTNAGIPSTITNYVARDITSYDGGTTTLARRLLLVPHMSQPNSYTCGATVLNMLINWENKRQKGSFLTNDTMAIYNYLNTDGSSGLATPELKRGLDEIPSFFGLGINYSEVKSNTIQGAIDYYLSNSLDRGVPIILYGNTNITGSSSGGHYYLGIGAASSTKGYPFVTVSGLYINDSVYGSPAYPPGTLVGDQAISSQAFVTVYDLENYWRPTGSAFPWARKHIFISIN